MASFRGSSSSHSLSCPVWVHLNASYLQGLGEKSLNCPFSFLWAVSWQQWGVTQLSWSSDTACLLCTWSVVPGWLEGAVWSLSAWRLLLEIWPTSFAGQASIPAVMGTAASPSSVTFLSPRLGNVCCAITGHGASERWFFKSSLYLTVLCHHSHYTVISSCCCGTKVLDSSWYCLLEGKEQVSML